jgi:hypothetical protein
MSRTYPEDTQSRLFVLGVIHRDDKGAELLNEWLSNIAPEVITLEFSNYGLVFRKERSAEYKEKIEKVLERMKDNNESYNKDALFQLFAYIDVPYEYEVAFRYAEERNALLYLVDMDDFSCLKLQQIDELCEENNIRQILYGRVGTGGNNEKAAARLFFEKGIKIFSYTNEMFIRDRYVSNRISVLMDQHKHKRFFHICGWQHLLDPYGLYARFNPEKAFFYDKTFCI